MAIELATAYVSLVPSMKGFGKSVAAQMNNIPAVAEAGRRSGLGWVKGAAKVLGGAAVAGIGATAGVAITKGFTRAIQLQDAQAKLSGLGHNAANVAGIMDNALAAVKGTAFGMGEAGSVAANMVAAGVKPGQDLERALKLVGDAATIAGTDMGSMGAIFGKVAAANKVQMDVINQLHDAGVPALSLLADQMGVTAEEASRMASAGEIDFATFQAAMEKGLGGAALKSGQTFTGAMKNMGAALGRLGAMFATPVVAGMPSVFSALTGAIDSAGTALKPVAERFAAWLVPALQATAAGIGKIGPAISGVFTLLKTGDFSGSIREALGVEEDSALVGGILRFRETALGIFQEVAGGVRAMVAAFRDGGTDVTSSGFAGVLESIGLAARNIWDAVGPTVQQLAPQVMSLAAAFSPLGIVIDGIVPVLPQLAQSLGQVAAAIGGVLAEALPVVAQAFGEVGAELAGAISAALPGLVPLFESLADVIPAITPALTSLVPMVAGLAVEAIKLVTPLITNEKTIKALVIAFAAWKVAAAGLALGAMVASVVRSTASWVANTSAMVANRVAMVAVATWSKLVVAGQTAMRVAQLALNVAMRANPIGLVITALTALVGGLTWFFTKTEAGKKIVEVAWGAIKTAISSVADWWTQTAWPAVQRVITWFGAAFEAAKVIVSNVWETIRGAISAAWNWINQWVFAPIRLGIDMLVAAFNFWRDVAVNAWNLVKSRMAAAWNWINQWVLTPFKLGLEVLKVVFNTVKDGISVAWSAVQGALKTGWDWINTWVFSPLKTGVSLIGDAFSNVKDAIGTAWNGIRDAAKAPVKFVLETVYNNGIRKWWNTVADAVGLKDLKLPEADVSRFASGGVLPGYTPGRDVHEFYSPTAGRLSLSGGEAIMRPEFTRAVGGAAGVARLNAWARSGAAFASGGVFGRAPETGGFPPEWMKAAWNGVTGFGKKLWDAGAFAAEIFADPVGAVKKAVAELARSAGTGGNAGGLFDIMSEFPGRLAGGLADKVKALLGEQQTDGSKFSGSPAGALGVARMSQIVRSLVPFARVTSGFRPGAITATGYPSMHGMGRAIDIAASRPGDAAGMMAIFNAIRAAYPNSTELIYSPANTRQLYKGRPYMFPEPTRGDHFDHVHWAMANGGVLPKLYDQGGWMPDGGVGVNLTGRPEAVLTPEESAGLKNGNFGGPLVGTIVVRDEHEAIDQLERMRRRELTRRRVTGVLR